MIQKNRTLKYLMLALLFTGSPFAITAENLKKSWNFDADKPGGIAVGFINEVGDWKVVADRSAPTTPNVLAQLAKNERPIFNVALASDINYANVDMTVRFKAIAGVIDQGGGVVWRARDSKNYYIARYNPLENNYRVYKVEAGRRMQLGTSEIKGSEGWHTLRITMNGDHIECFYDSKKYLDVNDSTFKEAGKIGLWTKADAQTHFDDLTVSGG